MPIIASMRTERDFDTSTLPKILEMLDRQLESLDLEVEVLQAAQSLVPLPSRTQVVRMREGALPLRVCELIA